MPKLAREMSAIEVSRLKTTGLHAVGAVPGLHLQVRGLARSWVLRSMVGTKRRDIGLGGYPAVTLAEARQLAREARQVIRTGVDPVLARKQARSALEAAQASEITFDEAARRFIDARSDEWKNAKHLQQWQNTLETYAAPIIGKLLVSDIRQEHVLSVLQPIWKTRTETASRLRGRIESVLDWAAVRGYRPAGDNPARWRGHLDMLLPKPGKIAVKEHHEALPIDAMPAFMVELRKHQGTGPQALELLILTAARSGEIRGAMWPEVDLDAATWVIPGNRMKAGKEHRVPLSPQAVALLRALPRIEGTDLVFAGRSAAKPLSDMTLTALMRRMGTSATPHGFRSTFRDWVAERTNYPGDLAEMALAHALPSRVEAAYRRGDMLEKRAHMMAAWAAFIDHPAAAKGGAVVSLKKVAA